MLFIADPPWSDGNQSCWASDSILKAQDFDSSEIARRKSRSGHVQRAGSVSSLKPPGKGGIYGESGQNLAKLPHALTSRFPETFGQSADERANFVADTAVDRQL